MNTSRCGPHKWQNIGTAVAPHWAVGSIRIAWQLVGFLRAMASITSGSPGGLRSGVGRSICINAAFCRVPHASPAAFSSYLNSWLTEFRPGGANLVQTSQFPPPDTF